MNIPAPIIEIHLIILYPVNTRPISPGTFIFRSMIFTLSAFISSYWSLFSSCSSYARILLSIYSRWCFSFLSLKFFLRELLARILNESIATVWPSIKFHSFKSHTNLLNTFPKAFEWSFLKPAMVLYFGRSPVKSHMHSILVCTSRSSFLVVRMP